MLTQRLGDATLVVSSTADLYGLAVREMANTLFMVASASKTR